MIDDGEGFCVGTLLVSSTEDTGRFKDPEGRTNLFSSPFHPSNGAEDGNSLVSFDASHGYREEVDDTFHNLHQAQLGVRARPILFAGS